MRYVLVLLVLAALPAVSAVGLVAHTPDENATADPAVAKFTFAAGQDYRDATLKECDFILNGAAHKTIRINDRLGGSSRQFTANIEDGTYQWHVLCRTQEGTEIWTQTRTVHLVTPEQSGVETYSSGVIRGSLVHEFTIRNVVGAEPLEVPNVRPGDYLKISVEVPPSKITKEYFVRGKFVTNDTPYLSLTYKQEELRLYVGRNTTVPMQVTSLVARLTGIEGTKSHLIFYPDLPDTAEPDTETNVTDDANETSPPPEEEPEPPSAPEEPETPGPPEQPEEEPQRQGFFSWVLSLLARLFGA